MKAITTMLLTAILVAGTAFAAGIDGKWVSEQKMERDGQSFTITRTFEFKSDANKLTGSVTTAFGDMEPAKAEIKEGKINGNAFSFSIALSTPNGDFKMDYAGTLEGELLKGTATREGAQARPFEAKRKQ